MNPAALPSHMVCAPTVFAVGQMYQIFIPFNCEVIVRIRVGEREFCDESNGILRSGNPIHQIEVPMELLDAAKAYTVSYRVMLERKPYFPVSEEPVEMIFAFKPVTGDTIRIYHIADTHNMPELPQRAGAWFGDELDLLILNGDIPDFLDKVENFNTTFEIAAAVTGGHIPVVFARGNHDARGLLAERFADYTPTCGGHTYYTFRLGSLWGMVLDCGEDKDDTHPEYGGTVCFHDFRLRQTDFIRRTIQNRACEYAAPGVKHRIVVCHIPFTCRYTPPFDPDPGIYAEWTRLMREEIEPEVFIFGHHHVTEIWRKGSERDAYGQPCDAVVGASPVLSPDPEKRAFVGTALTLSEDGVHVVFSDHNGAVVSEADIARRA